MEQTPQSSPSPQLTFSSLLPSAMALFALMIAFYGGMSYGFYHFGATLPGLGFVIGLIAILLIMIRTTRGFFNKFSGRLNFAVFLIASLGAYFIFLFQTGKYPMGIDLAGGTELTYRLDYTRALENIKNTELARAAAEAKDADSKETQDLKRQVAAATDAKNTASDKAAEVVRKRIDPTGTKGIPVTTLGSNHDRLRIQLPKATTEEVNIIKKAVQTRGHLAFHIDIDDQTIIQSVQHSLKTRKLQLQDGDWYDAHVSPDGLYEERIIRNINKISKGHSDRTIVVRALPDMDGSHIVRASARPDSQSGGGWEINVAFDSAGGVEFGRLTKNNIQKKMAVVLDDIAYLDPVIQDQINNDCRISGNFTEKEAESDASILTAGSLPADIIVDSSIEVGPSLGREQITSGMTAMVIGTSVVILFMLVYYRFSGWIASLCMLLNLPMLLGAMGFFKATLTLPGIAGIVLTLGMAVDANVLIIERLREELARGRNLRQAVSYGFDRAFLTIIDCHSTTLISSIILYYMGTGPVRGFAVSLSVGILTTLFCNLWLNWLIMDWLVSRDALPNLKMMQFFKHTTIDFMGQRRMWMTITGAAAVISLVLFVADQKDLYDVDFTGGTRIQFNFARGKGQDQEQVRRTMSDVEKQLKTQAAELLGKGEASLEVQSIGSAEAGSKTKFQSYTVTTRLTDSSDPKLAAAVSAAINNLKLDLLAAFKGDLEPDPVTATDKNIEVRFTENVPAAEAQKRVTDVLALAAKDPANDPIRPALTALKPLDSKTEPGYIVVELSPVPADPAVREKVMAVIGGAKIEGRADGSISRTDAFGAQVAGEMWWYALWALIFANTAVFIYIWFRFEFSGAWGFGAIVALVHDTVIATGGVVLLHILSPYTGFAMRIDLNIVAALLTITGFSVNDTIVVFDRIREVKHAHPTRGYEEIVNEAVNATLSRTILTSLTVLLADGALLIFGGPTIRGMAYTLLVGFAVGTYSSIFIAAPLMIWWWRKFGAGAGAPPATSAAGSRPKTDAAASPQV